MLKEKVLDLLDEKVNDIFYQLQEELNITDGNIYPLDKFELDKAMEQLTEKIIIVLESQQ